MNTVNITTTKVYVSITEEVEPGKVVVTELALGKPEVIAIVTQGPQGIPGLNIPVVDSAKVDKSVVYYDAPTSTYRVDSTWTVNTLTDGGNF